MNTLWDIVQNRKPHKVSPNPEVRKLPIDFSRTHCGRVVQDQNSYKVPQTILQRALVAYLTERRSGEVAQPLKPHKVTCRGALEIIELLHNNVWSKTSVLIAERKLSLTLATLETAIPCEREVTREDTIEGATNTSNTWWVLWHSLTGYSTINL